MGPWSENVTEGGKEDEEDESDLFLGMGVYQQYTPQKKSLHRAGLQVLENYQVIWWLLPELLRQQLLSWPCGLSFSVPSWHLLQGLRLQR